MHANVLTCPPVGHKQFEKSLPKITIGNADTPNQISKVIRPRSCVVDDLGIEFAPGELQRVDLAAAVPLFEYRHFVVATFERNKDVFTHSQCRIYQFQTHTSTGSTFIFGLFITDGAGNLIDFCVDTSQREKRRSVLVRLIRAMCTRDSVARKLSH